MNKNFIKIIFGISAVLLISLFARPQIAQAVSYSVGTLVKYEKQPAVYYIASDGYAYPFPDEVTYKTWYSDFSKVETLSWRTFHYIKRKSTPITVYPTSRFVKFENSNKVYAVMPGAELRWITDEGIAKKIGGKNWDQRIITLPVKNVVYYTIGQSIKDASEINDKHEIRNDLAIDRELKLRNVITLAQTKKTNQTSYGADLRSIKENLKDSMDPKFSRDETSYELVANYDETEIKFTIAAYDSTANITINDLPIPKGSAVAFKLDEPGKAQIFYIKSSLPNEKEKTYKIRVRHEWPNTENDLSALTENLRDSLSPKFNPDVRFYRIQANEKEKKIIIRPRTKSKYAEVRVNGKLVKNGSSYTKELTSVETIIEIDVKAQNGKQKTYIITIEKER